MDGGRCLSSSIENRELPMKYWKTCLLATLLPLAWQSFAAAHDDDADSTPSITVTGVGEMGAKPDVVYITMGIETRGKDAVEALRENNEAMERLFDNLKFAGIEKKDIQTSNFNINPQYENPQPSRGNASQTPRITGYQVSNRVRIKSRKIDELGSLLDSVVKEGANSIYGIQFDVADPQAVEDEARLQAMKDARRKAELLAKATGARVGAAIRISEFGSTPEPMGRMAEMRMATSSVPIAEGEQQIRATVTVTYQLNQN
jgi:uncharacterized protein YggE